MGKVQLKIPPWMAILLKAHNYGYWIRHRHTAEMDAPSDSDWLILEREIGEGATIAGLLTELTFNYTGFRKVVFNPDVGTVSDQLMVFLNENLLQESDIIETKLNDGDTIMLLSVYAGG